MLLTGSSDKASQSTEAGRAQTPELTTEEVVKRHHLDVTTPNKHGLLLASPPRQSYQSSKRVEQKNNSMSANSLICIIYDDRLFTCLHLFSVTLCEFLA